MLVVSQQTREVGDGIWNQGILNEKMKRNLLYLQRIKRKLKLESKNTRLAY